MTESIIVLILLIILAIALWLILLTSSHAYRRGYNPVVWALAAIFSMNPIFLFVVLAIAPHRSRLRLRAQFRAELDAKLHGGDRGASGRLAGPIPLETQTTPPRRGQPVHPPLDVTQTYSGNATPK